MYINFTNERDRSCGEIFTLKKEKKKKRLFRFPNRKPRTRVKTSIISNISKYPRDKVDEVDNNNNFHFTLADNLIYLILRLDKVLDERMDTGSVNF